MTRWRRRNVRFAEAIEFHIEGLVEDGLPIPEPQTVVEYVPARAAG